MGEWWFCNRLSSVRGVPSPGPIPKTSSCSHRPHPSSISRLAMGVPNPSQAFPTLTPRDPHLLFPRTILRQVENREGPRYHQPQPLKEKEEDGQFQPYTECPEWEFRWRSSFSCLCLVSPRRGYIRVLTWGHIPGEDDQPPLPCTEALPVHPHTRWSTALAWPPCLPAPWACPTRLDTPEKGVAGVIGILLTLFCFSVLRDCATATTRRH